MADHSHVAQPKPLRPSFTLTTSSTPSTPSPTTPADPSQDTFLSRTKSVLNLTSSTLFGIYTPDSDPNATPWGNGSQTPAPRQSMDDEKRPPVIGAMAGAIQPERRKSISQRRQSPTTLLFRYSVRTILLFAFGVAYGTIISHLHDSRKVAPVQVPGIERSWAYLLGWGVVAVALGGLTPWVDVLWEDILGIEKDANFYESSAGTEGDERSEGEKGSRSGLGTEWNPVVRSIGAFVGIAFAIRKLPWQSTSQVSLTLALVNPVLWYLVDRSKPGFILSTIVGLSGTAIVFGVNPDIVPSPAAASPRAGHGPATGGLSDMGILHQSLISSETIGVATWIASVFFCSSVCFGNVGRKLALGVQTRRASIS